MHKPKQHKPRWRQLGMMMGAYVLAQQMWVFWKLFNSPIQQTLAIHHNAALPGCTFSTTHKTEHYIRSHTVEDGIERIVYRPTNRRFETPIVMQHGMWHGAWCWELWQALFAEWGWETHAHSLPGHGQSAVQRPVRWCTLYFYLGFLRDEIARAPVPPVLMGHSMGGALTQWYLKYVSDELPAAVLIAPWVSHSMFKDGLLPMVTYDPLVAPLMMFTWDASPFVRSGRHSAVRFLVGPRAAIPLAELQPRLGPESALVLYQHNPPFWYPPKQVRCPMLWVAGEADPLLVESAERRSAAHYGADYLVADDARHNVMMEHNYRWTAEQIHQWLAERIP